MSNLVTYEMTEMDAYSVSHQGYTSVCQFVMIYFKAAAVCILLHLLCNYIVLHFSAFKHIGVCTDTVTDALTEPVNDADD